MSVVKVRVWAAKQGEESVRTDVAAVVAQATRIWATAGVPLEIHRQEKVIALPAVTAAGADPNATIMKLVPAALAPTLNPVIAGGGPGWIDVVLLPIFDRWGHAFSPLTKQVGDTTPAYAPFVGPVVIVTTEHSRPNTGAAEARSTAFTSIAEAPVDAPVVAATGNDVAHEIGHLLGLWHTVDVNPKLNPPNEVPKPPQTAHRLMHATLYSQAATSRSSVTGSRSWVKAATEAEQAAMRVGRSGDWFIVMRGEVVDEPSRVLAKANITSGAVWAGVPITV